MKLPDKVYEVLKWLSCIAIDAVGLLYETLAGIWGLPYGEEVFKTCAAISIFLGALIGVSTYNYRKEQNKIDMQPELDGKE